MENGVHLIDRETCIRCGDCVPECPVKALTLCGKEIEAADVIKEVVHDKSYYQEDGGMTISGGEPLIQRDFVRELVFLAKEEGLGVALETNGYYNFSLLDGIKEHVDIFLIDWKETDPQKHREYTAVPNDIIYANIKRLHDEGRRILVRCPIIPGLNDREDHFRRIAEITRELPNLIGAELLPYHNLGVSKNERFGLTGELESVSLDQPDPEVVEGWIQFTRDCGGRLINET
jgi:pyruvate formate lyase activating enzyme